MHKTVLSWTDVQGLTAKLLARLRRDDFDAILCITRGGMVPGCLLSEALDLRNVLTAAVMFYTDSGQTLEAPQFLQFPSDPLLVGKRILVVDDVWDSGRTIVAVRERVQQAGGEVFVATLHYKPSQNLFADQAPDLYAEATDGWIVYPWDPSNHNPNLKA